MTALGGRSSLGLLRDRRFAKFITSSAVNAFANQVALLAIPLIAVVTLRASPFQVAAVTALSTAAFLLVGLPAGALVDRLRPRAVIAVADGARSLVALTIPLAWWAGHLSIWLLYAVAFTTGIANVFSLVARQSYLPLLVARSDLTEGNAKLAGIEQVFRLGGPGLAGQVIAILTAPFALVVTCVSLAFSSAAVLWIPESAAVRRPVRGRPRLIHEVGVGLAFVLRNRLLRAMAISVSWSNLFGLAYSSMMTIYLANSLRLSPALIGLVMSISGAGGVIGALVARRLSRLVGQGPLMWLSMLVGMPFLAVLPLVHNADWVWVAAIAYAIAVCCMVVMNIVQGTVRQTITPPALLGRVSSTFRFLTWGTAPVGAVLGGVLGSWIGPRSTLLVAAAGTCFGFVSIFRSPLRRMREVPAADGHGRCDGPLPVTRIGPTGGTMTEAGVDGVVATESDLDFWRRTLAGVRPPDLPTDHARLDAHGGSRGSVPFTVHADLVAGLRQAAATHDCSVSVVLLSVFQTLLSRYTGQSDIAVATPAGPPDTEHSANTLLIRADLARDPVVGDLLAQTRKATAEAFAHRGVPFEDLPGDVTAEYDLARTPLFQVGSVLVGSTAAFDLTLSFVERDAGLVARFWYGADLFDQSTVQRMVGHYQTLLANVIADPSVRLGDLELLTPAERRQLLVEWNDTGIDFPRDVCVHELVGRQAAIDPDAVAVVSGTESLTYGQLTARANQLARFLVERGVGPDVLVGVCLPRSLDLVVALLGVLQAGAAYVPMDPEYPAQRLAFLLSDAATPVVLTHSALRDRLPARDVVAMDEDWARIGALADTEVTTGVCPDDLAYVIYTSGSAGEPKGVQIEHRGLVNLVHWHRSTFGIGPGKRATLAASMAFDAMAWDLWSALAAGATASMPTANTVGDPQRLRQWIIDERFDVTFLPTPVAETVLALPWSGSTLGYLLTGGDRLTTMPDTNLPFAVVNNYGPTETTVVATSGTVSPGQPVHIGRPVSNVVVYVVDHADRLLPIGVPGELLIGGVGVGRGYLNRPELTAQRFTTDPFSSDHCARVYRSGDIVRWTPDGNLEFVGRRDDQVKVRGFRIELGEVESVLAGRHGVASCVVTVREDKPGARRLVSYCVPADGVSLSATALRKWCERSLPSHLVPSAFVLLRELPLTANGKVDRKALPAPDGTRPNLGNGFVAPRSAAERTVARIWSDILWVDEVGIHDDFFELGGDSLMAARVISQVRDELGIDIAIRTLFDSPVLGQFTTALASVTRDTIARGINSSFGPMKTESSGGQS